MPSNVINDLQRFLRNHKATSNDKITHTRIGDKKLGIYGGSYCIDGDNLTKFLNIYRKTVFEENTHEYLTEKQIDNGPILVDFDFRYDISISTRQHDEETVISIMDLYTEKLKKILKFEDDKEFPIYIFEKPSINVMEKEEIVKDGIHMIIGISMPHKVQSLLRDEVLKDIENQGLELPLENTWDSVLDRGITEGYTNWQMYGSRKPNNQAYQLTKYYMARIDLNDGEFVINEMETSSLDLQYDLIKLSAQYSKHPAFELNESFKDKLNPTKKKKPKLKLKSINTNYDINDIKNVDELDSALEHIINTNDSYNFNRGSFSLKEIHGYVMLLPESYYGKGSYDKWIRVGLALYHTDRRLFLSWIKFSSQSKDFDFSDIPGFFDFWKKFGENKKEELTHRSIMFWARNDAPRDKYDEFRRETLDHYIDITVAGDFMPSHENKKGKEMNVAQQCARDYDLAVVLYQMFKDQFICYSQNGRGKWMKFDGNRWLENEEAWSLRKALSEEMYSVYQEKVVANMSFVQTFEEDDPRWNAIRTRTHNLAQCCQLLKKSSPKDNILKEAKALFYDKDFLEKQDQYPYLLCYNNGVYDFKENIFRDGRPEDYISKSTNIDYIPLSKINQNTLEEINEFMEQLFPIEELRNYMWQHLASTLIGTNENQTFNIYTGCGRNGKSMLVMLMSKILGEYKGTVPITLITQKRNSIGGTSSEVVQLKGLRYAVMQEPTKGDQINEGIMKEITGGDPIQGRALYKEMITFMPQFKLAVCTNTLFDIKSNDDGTWRRIRVCPFMSKFTENPVDDDEDSPYQYKVNKKLDERFDDWGPVFMAKLVDIASKAKGNVEDCKIVMARSEEYREGQDYLAEFNKEMIEKSQDSVVKKDELYEEFCKWYREHYGRIVPKGKEIYDYMNKKYGKCKKKMWSGVRIIYQYDEEQQEETGEVEENE
tara:strand:+ start:6379 stop:9195 length:2817 start_codon:yes stop_codon:yes gene_type:complete